jgi:hypothetical protein
VDANAGSFNSFFIEDDDGTEVTIDNAKELKIIGSGVTTNFTDTSTGSDGDPFDLTITVDAAQTGITSILATDLKIGEDDQTKIDFETADEIHFYAANAEQVFVSDGVFGPQTDSDVDLGTTGARFKDAYIDSATITGAFTAGDGCTITTADNDPQLTLVSTDADATQGPVLKFYRNSASPADNDLIGQLLFHGEDGAGNDQQYANIQSIITNNAHGNESSSLNISTIKGGSVEQSVKFGATETVFNESSLDLDFRVESDSQMAAFFVEGSSSNIGIGHNTPTADSSLAGVSVPAGTKYVHIHDGDGAVLKLSDPSDGSNRGAQFGMIGTDAILNNCESGSFIFGRGNAQVGEFDGSGTFLVGKTSDSFGTDGVALKSSGEVNMTRTNAVVLSIRRNGNEGNVIEFYEDANAEGSISVSTTGTTYNTTSDIRLKENIEPLKATDKLMEMNPVSYNWKSDPDGPRNVGFIAQEMQKIVPESVNISEDENKTMGMDYGRITPILVSALQDAHKKIEELENRIAAMESK